jgi:LPXTG-motif cell wall-anchored protein
MQLTMRSFMVLVLSAAGLGLVGSSAVQRAKADAWDKMTYVTINEKIIAGNRVLEPGTYVWKLMDSQSDRHIVQIFNKEQNHLYETILAIPDYRLQPTSNSKFAFWETPPGVPKAVRAWFYPGDNFGQEFVYPKKLVAQLASAAPTPIPMSYKEPEPEPAAVPAAASAPAPAATPAPEPQPQPVAAEAAPEPAPQSAPAISNPAPQSLPKTASNTPLIALLGLMSFGMAGILSATAKRS